MTRDNWLLTLLAAVCAWSAGQAWLAQLSGYPLWPSVGPQQFSSYLAAWMRAEWQGIAIPLVLSMSAAAFALWRRPVGVPPAALWTLLGLALLSVVLTFARWIPEGTRLAGTIGLEMEAFTRFTRSHWLRVALVSATAALAWWMLGRNLGVAHSNAQGRVWLLMATAAFAWMGAGQVWMVQTLCYRVWTLVGRSDFYAYHFVWWHSIWLSIFVPAGLALVGAIALLCRPPSSSAVTSLWTGLGIEVLLYVLTAAWWGRLMARLATQTEGLLADRYNLLMSTHWLRVAIVTAYALTVVWTIVRAASTLPAASATAR